MDRGNRSTGQGRRGYQQGPNAGQRNDHDSFNRPSNWQGPQPNYYDRNDSRSTHQNQERDSFDNQEPMRNRGRNQAQNNYQSDNRENRGNQQNDDDIYQSGRGLEGRGGRGQSYDAREQRRDQTLQQEQGGRSQNFDYISSRRQSQGYNDREQDDTAQYAQGNQREHQNYNGRKQQGQSVRGQQRQNGRGPHGQGGRRQQDQGYDRAQYQDKREQYPQGNTNEDQSDRNQDGHGGGRQQRSQGYNGEREQFQDERAQYSQGNRNQDQSYSGRGLQGHGGKGLQGHFDREQQSQEYFEGEQFYDDFSKSAQLSRNQDQVNRGQQSQSNKGKKDQRGRGQGGRGQQRQGERGQQGNCGIWQDGSQSSQMPYTTPPLYNTPPPLLSYPTFAPMAFFIPPPYLPMQHGQSLLPTPPPPPQPNFKESLPRSSSTYSVDSVGVKKMNKSRTRNNGERDQERTNRDDTFNEDQRNLGRSCSMTSINTVGSNDLRQPSGNKNQRGPNRMYRQDPINNIDENYEQGDLERSSSIRNIQDIGGQSRQHKDFRGTRNDNVDTNFVSYRGRSVHDRVGPSGRGRGRGISRGGRPDNRTSIMPNQEVSSACGNSINRGMGNSARYRGNRSGRGALRGDTTRRVVRGKQPNNLNVKNSHTNSTTAMAHRLLRGNTPSRGRMSGMLRGNRSIGRIMSKWHGFVGRQDAENDDASSCSTKDDDFDDNMSTCSDFSQASNFTEDISDALNDTKVEIMLEDINTVGLPTLKNRIMRYKKKLADMRKKPENNDTIKKFQEQLAEVRKLYRQRMNEEHCANNDNTQSKNTKTEDPKLNKKVNVEAVDHPLGRLNTDTKTNSKSPKAKRVSALVAAKCHVSFNPKSKKQSKGKHIVKKPAKQSSDDETCDECNDVSDEEVKLNPPFVENTKEPNIKGIIDLLSEFDYILEQKEPLTEKKQPAAIDKQKKTEKKLPSAANSQSYVLDIQKKAEDKQAADKKKLARKPEEASSGPDVNAIFKFVVKNFEGKGTPEEIVRESGLFPVDYDAIGWFRKVRNRFYLLERNGIVDVVFVCIKNATYCMDYIRNTSCSKADCQRYHVCKDMLAGNCVRGVKCKFSHDMLDERNMRISKELGFDNIFTSDEICSILRVRYPHICPSWIENGTCIDTRCIGLHLCPRYILGNCLEGDTCPMIHDRFSGHNKPIVECYYMEKWVENLFRKSLYMIRRRSAEGDEIIEPIKANEVRGVNAAANSNSPSKRRLKSDKSREETDPSNDLVICDLVLMDKGCKKCKLIHGSLQLPYLWQVNLFGSWFTHQRSEDVEKTFCDNKDLSDRYHVIHNQMELKVVVIFKPSFKALVDIIGAECTTEATEARRLSTPSYKEGDENSASFKTQWRWYWQDDDKDWHLFEPDTLQHTLEMKYLAKQSNYNYSRENYRFKYSVDFNAMVQYNIDTGNQRTINRVPVFVSSEDIKTKTTPRVLSPAPSIETPLPENWVPWDLAHPFELVRLAENSTDYQTVSDHFYKTLDIEKQKIESVFHLQNHKLWGLFCKQEKFMEAELKRLGSDAPLNKLYLFHGTDNLDAVRGICINNFDNRVSGKNATMHGDGAYFARDAKYSHCYTKPPLRFMFMVTALIGQYAKGDKSYRRPPNKPGNDHELFDSCVDDVNNPSVYVVFDKNLYYPEFLIHYRNANDESSGDGLEMSSCTSYSGGSGNVTAANLNCPSTVGSGLTSHPSYRSYPPPSTVQQPVAYPRYSTPSHAGPQTSFQPFTYNPANTTPSTSTAPLERKKDDCCIQ